MPGGGLDKDDPVGLLLDRAPAPAEPPGRSPVVVIVDPLSTGVWLAPEFQRRGWQCVAVLSGTVPPPYASRLRREDFVDVLTADEDPAIPAIAGPVDMAAGAAADPAGTLVDRLAALRADLVIPGCEWGVNLADDLAGALGLPGNEPLPGRPRREKDTMMRRVSEAGLRVPVGVAVTSTEELDACLAGPAAGIAAGPVVVKPVASAASDGVYFCVDVDQVRAAFHRLIGTSNSLGLRNDTLLVQERLVGQQYFVNSVSLDGRHHIHEIWRDDRLTVDGRPVYDRQVLLPARGEIQGRLAAFVRRVLDALGVRNGPAHTELIDDGELALIESGARLEGGVDPRGPRWATGESQVSLTVERYADPTGFAARIDAGYPLRNALAVVCLVAPHDGVLDADGLRRLAGIPSVRYGSALSLAPGTPVRRTVDLFSSPGALYLVGDDAGQLEQDHRRIRELEAGGLYRSRWGKPTR